MENSDEALWNALELSHLKPFVENLPEGLEYECGENGESLRLVFWGCFYDSFTTLAPLKAPNIFVQKFALFKPNAQIVNYGKQTYLSV